MTFTSSDKLAAIERELKYRRYVYTRRVAAHQMTQQAADYQIAIFEAIAEDYRALVKLERLL